MIGNRFLKIYSVYGLLRIVYLDLSPNRERLENLLIPVVPQSYSLKASINIDQL